MKTSVCTLAFFALVAGAALASGPELTKCVAGQEVTDKEGKTGVILADDSKLCRVQYPDGQVYSWIFWNLRPSVGAVKSGSVRAPGEAGGPSAAADNQDAVSIIRPSVNRTLVYRADRHGNFAVPATINGAPIRAVVDTGANLVALTLDDAEAAGIRRGELVFSGLTQTANGPARFAPVILREVRIDRVAVENVRAAVMENLHQSLLGMSFLNRIKSFEMREGTLTISW